MRVATWNINDVRKRLPILLAWLDATKPDAVALQELKCSDSEFPRAALDAAGYGSLVCGQKAWNGVALLARGDAPVEVRRRLPGEPKDVQARYLEGAVSGVLMASLYAPNGNPSPGPKFAYKLAWLERFNLHASELLKAGHPVVLAGDYNVVPTDKDIYCPKTWLDNALLQPQPREAFSRLLKQGWTDSLRKLHPEDNVYTFWDYRRNRWQRNAGLRIDHLLLSSSLKTKLVAAGVDREVRGLEGTSDHAPAWVDIR